MKLVVAVDYDDFTGVSQIGRVTFEAPAGDQIVLDGSPRSAIPERLEATDKFIGDLHAAYAKA